MGTKVKLHTKRFGGKTDSTGRLFFISGSALLDITEERVREKMPDDVQVAFEAWSHWEKLGNDSRYGPYDTERGYNVAKDFEFDPAALLRKAGIATHQLTVLPFIYERFAKNLYRMMNFEDKATGVKEAVCLDNDLYNLVMGLYREAKEEDELTYGETKFFTEGIDKPIFVMKGEKCLALVLPFKLQESEIKFTGLDVVNKMAEGNEKTKVKKPVVDVEEV